MTLNTDRVNLMNGAISRVQTNNYSYKLYKYKAAAKFLLAERAVIQKIWQISRIFSINLTLFSQFLFMPHQSKYVLPRADIFSKKKAKLEKKRRRRGWIRIIIGRDLNKLYGEKC